VTLQQSFLIDPLLASMLDGLQEAVWLLDAQTLRVVHANAASMQLTGYTPEQAQEQYVDVLCASLVQKAFWQDASNWVGGAKFLTEICTANGSLTAVEMGVGSIALNPRWLMLTMLDRSEQLRHESELDMLLAELRATLESAADGMLVCDLRGGIRAFNHRFAELWQLPEPLLVQRDDAAIFAHLEAQTISSESQFTLLQDAQDLSAPETSEVLQLLSGRVLERRSVPQLSRGVAIGRIYSYRDITVESSSATELRLAARVFESSLDGIFIADANGVIVQVNPAGGQLLHGKAVLGLAAWTLFESEGGCVRPAGAGRCALGCGQLLGGQSLAQAE
jgi:PAS domain-containing protein